jgi:hypothetical protein
MAAARLLSSLSALELGGLCAETPPCLFVYQQGSRRLFVINNLCAARSVAEQMQMTTKVEQTVGSLDAGTGTARQGLSAPSRSMSQRVVAIGPPCRHAQPSSPTTSHCAERGYERLEFEVESHQVGCHRATIDKYNI